MNQGAMRLSKVARNRRRWAGREPRGDETDTSKVARKRMRWAGREPRGDETDTSKVARNQGARTEMGRA